MKNVKLQVNQTIVYAANTNKTLKQNLTVLTLELTAFQFIKHITDNRLTQRKNKLHSTKRKMIDIIVIIQKQR